MIAKNLPTSASRLRPTTLRLSIIGLEMSLVPLLLSIATTVTFFVFPESHLYLALRSMWPGIYLVNVLLCLLCKSNKRHIILISHNMRNADSFGNLPNDFFEKGRWTFNPPTFGAKSTTPAAPVPAMPPSAYDIKSYVPVNEPDPDDASVYSTNTTQHPIASYYLQKSPVRRCLLNCLSLRDLTFVAAAQCCSREITAQPWWHSESACTCSSHEHTFATCDLKRLHRAQLL